MRQSPSITDLIFVTGGALLFIGFLQEIRNAPRLAFLGIAALALLAFVALSIAFLEQR